MKRVSKRELWNEIKKDSFLKLLVETFGAQKIAHKGLWWEK